MQFKVRRKSDYAKRDYLEISLLTVYNKYLIYTKNSKHAKEIANLRHKLIFHRKVCVIFQIFP